MTTITEPPWSNHPPYLNSVKKLSGSNKSAHSFFSSRMSLHISSPRLNSPIIMSLVECVTLKVEFCWGYAGVMMGIKWYLSAGLIWEGEREGVEDREDREVAEEGKGGR